ncbi:MAG: hypothetical protein M1587_11790 [Thaumarchaeota archaeon]|nr:hypothetical protein [Nitrososphaerota archaeon]
MSNKTAYRISGAALAILGGLLLIVSGYRTSSFILTVLSFSEKQAAVPSEVKTVITIAIPILTFVISLGGILVICGGILLLLKHKTSATFLIALGGGVGFIGIIIGLGYNVYEFGPAAIIAHFDYWIGVLVASIGRALAKKS